MKRRTILIFGLFILPTMSIFAFDDTIFNQPSVSDLDLDTSKKKKVTEEPKMVIKSEVVDGQDLPVVGNPSVKVERQPIKLPRGKRPEPGPSGIMLDAGEGIGDTSDLDVVQTNQLNWKLGPLVEKPGEAAEAKMPEPEAPEVVAAAEPTQPMQMKPVSEPPTYVIPAMSAKRKKKRMGEGAKISAYLVKIPTSDAIRVVAAAASEKVMMPHDIPGDVTLDFKNRHWLWVVETVLKSKHYVWTYHDEILVVQKDNLKVKGPLQQAIFRMKYASAKIMHQKIKPFLSKHGSVLDDNQHNLLIVSDYPDVIDQIASLIEITDTPNPTIVIDTRLVEVSKGVVQQFGLNQSSSRLARRHKFNLQQVAKNFGLPNGTSLGTLLSQLERNNKAKIVSAPRVVTLNNKDAKFSIKNVLFADELSEGSINAETFIQVKPRIMNKDWVELTLLINHAYESEFNSELGSRTVAGHVTKTTLSLKNGETALISGIQSSGSSAAPAKDHLLIFVTPHFTF